MTKLRVLMPAEVVSYSPPVPGKSPALVRVLPHFKTARIIDNPGELRAGETLLEQTDKLLAIKNLPEIPNRPVMYLGHFGMRTFGPLEVGEVGLYVVMDRSIDQWINTGGPLDPSTNELHDLTDGVFIPGLRSGVEAQNVPSDVDVVGREDGTAGMFINRETKSVEVKTDGPAATLDAAIEVKLGAGAVLGVARTTDAVTTSAALNLFQAQTLTALTTIAAAVPVVIVPPVPTTAAGAITGGSTKVKAES